MSKDIHGSECDCGCNDEEYDTMTLTLDDGTELECGVLAVFPVDDKQYIALLPLNDEKESEEGVIYLYQYVEHDNDEFDLLNIENDDEYEAVADAFDEILDSAEFDELFEDDEA